MRVRVHQAVHGYADGHRQLACSIELEPRDARLSLVLSDSSGPDARIPPGGYLTGYPLPASGLYAIARTWPAPEMRRPGCVWTHTLLIDFTDLPEVSDARTLDALFRRPDDGDLDRYRSPVEPVEVPEPASDIDGADALRLLSAIYGEPGKRIVAAPQASTRDGLILAIWSQQWPRLRRSFRFCSLAVADRSIDAAAFDVQFLAEAAAARRFPDAIQPKRGAGDAFEGWAGDAASDLAAPGPSDLRDFLRRAGSETDAGRRAFAPLVRMHKLLVGEWDATSAPKLMAILDDPPAAAGRYLKERTADRLARHAKDLDEAGFDFVLRHLSSVVDASARKAFGDELWTRCPEVALRATAGAGPDRDLVLGAIQDMTARRFLEVVARTPGAAPALLALRPSAANDASFWEIPGIQADAALRALEGVPEEPVVDALLACGGGLHARAAIGRFHTAMVWDRVAAAGGQDMAWIAELACDRDAVARLLASGRAWPRAMLTALAKILPPEAVPNRVGDDPWLSALTHAAEDGMADRGFLAAHILARVLKRRTRSAAPLAQMTFMDVHSRLAEQTLPEEAWLPIKRAIGAWTDWDRCGKLREAVADNFFEAGLPPASLDDLSGDDDVFAALVARIAGRWGGRDYLKQLRRALRAQDSPRAGKRTRIVEDAIDL